MKTRRRGWQQGWIWLLVVGIIAAAVNCRAQETELLKRATKVVELSEGLSTRWLSPTQLFMVDPSKHMCYRYDTGTEEMIPLKALAKQVSDNFRYATPHISPYGEWVLWLHGESDNVRGARLDGSGAFQYLPSYHGPQVGSLSRKPEIHWMSDSQHWVVFGIGDDYEPYAMIYDVNHPGKPTILPATCSDRLVDVAVVSGRFSTQSLVADDRILCKFQEIGQSILEIVEIGIDRPQSSLKTYKIKLLPHSELRELKISPSGEKLAWILTDGEEPLTTSVWVSHIDGTHMHRVGQGSTAKDTDAAPKGLDWVPDEQSVSFVYHEVLWTLPID